MPTETDLGHTTEIECIEALEKEVVRLKAALRGLPASDALHAPAKPPVSQRPALDSTAQ